jgi:hypothetical protein
MSRSLPLLSIALLSAILVMACFKEPPSGTSDAAVADAALLPDADTSDAADTTDAAIADAAGPDAAPECDDPPCDWVVAEFPLQNRDVDILFVVDNSGSMAEEQASLVNNFQHWVNVLENIEGGLPNLHVGVVSADVGAGPFNISGCTALGDNGALQSAPTSEGCAPPSDNFISDISDGDGGRIRNYTGTLSESFGCIARLGIDGCGFEQPLESMRRALNGSNPINSGFLRPSANLAVIIISDEDDCSTEDTNMFDTSQDSIDDPLGPLSSFRCFEFGVVCEPDTPRLPGPRTNCQPRDDSAYMYSIDPFAAFLKALKPDPRMVTVSAIVGNPTPVVVGVDDDGQPELNPSCVSASGDADPAVRLAAFLDEFPEQHTITTICNEDISDALILVAEHMAVAQGGRCLSGTLYDTDPVTAGTQYSCQVADVVPGTGDSALPECDNAGAPESSTNVPCHLFQANAICAESGIEVTVYRGDTTPVPGTEVVVNCLVN